MYILQESTHFTHFVAIYAYFYVTLGGSAQIITILHRGGSARFITILHRGGSAQFITILHREGGVYRDPQNVLRNIWTAPYVCMLNIEFTPHVVIGLETRTRVVFDENHPRGFCQENNPVCQFDTLKVVVHHWLYPGLPTPSSHLKFRYLFARRNLEM